LEGILSPHVVIADNGQGMNKEEIVESMRFGTEREYDLGELGKYGLGLKTASLGQCEKLTVLSRKKNLNGEGGKINIVRWDLKKVERSNKWSLSEIDKKDLKPWEAEVTDHVVLQKNGTVILWQDLSEKHLWMLDSNVTVRKRILEECQSEVRAYLRMVFHRFLNKRNGIKKVEVYVNGKKLTPWDPFALKQCTKKLAEYEAYVTNQQTGKKMPVKFTPYILPHKQEFSSYHDWQEVSGPNGWNRQQGLYIYRNNRLICSGSWNRLRRADEHTKLLRISVEFPSELDREFGVNITKMKAIIPQEIKESIRMKISEWSGKARVRYDRGERKVKPEIAVHNKVKKNNATIHKFGKLEFQLSQASSKIAVLKNHDGRNGLRFIVPLESEASRLFLDRNILNNNLAKVALVYHATITALVDGKLMKNEIPLDDLTKQLLKHL
jgi:hypothetical protein